MGASDAHHRSLSWQSRRVRDPYSQDWVKAATAWTLVGFIGVPLALCFVLFLAVRRLSLVTQLKAARAEIGTDSVAELRKRCREFGYELDPEGDELDRIGMDSAAHADGSTQPAGDGPYRPLCPTPHPE